MALSKVTINGPLLLPDDLTPQRGKLIFTPGSGLLVDSTDGITLAGSVPVTIADDGTFAIALPATDNTGTQPEPNSWNWTVRFELYDTVMEPFSFALPASLETVKFADLVRVLPAPGTYLVVPGQPGADGEDGAPGGPGSPGTAGAAGHTPQLYGGSAAPSTLHSDGDLYLRTNGDLYQQTASSWGSPVGNIQGPAGAGGGSTERTVRVRITDDNLSGLPSAPTWTVVVTSAGTPLVCKIKAAVGDRIEVYPNWMREGSHFDDLVILKADGTIWGYASADGGPTPGSEGNPDEYPALNESYVTSADEFTVVAENIDGSGFVTIGVAHQGTGAGKVFAHTVYPWRIRLKNIGPEPA